MENEQEGGIRKRKEAQLQSSVNKSCPEFPFSEPHRRSRDSGPKIAQQHLFRTVCCPHLPQKKVILNKQQWVELVFSFILKAFAV